MPDSVTIYQMELPFNTRFSGRILDGSFDVPLATWEDKRAWHDYAFNELAKVGYEVSSAYTMVRSKETTRFVYRDSVWAGCDLLGTGVASFSHIERRPLPEYRRLGRVSRDPGRRDSSLTVRALPTSDREQLIRELILQLKRGYLDDDLLQGQVRRRSGRRVRAASSPSSPSAGCCESRTAPCI